MKHRRIAIIGPYPPPYGGISVHIQRILSHMPNNSYVFFNISRSSKGVGKRFYGIYKYLHLVSFLFVPYKLLHYHSTSTMIRVLLSLIGIFKPYIYLHLHGESFTDTIRRRGVSAFILKQMLPRINILASNPTLVKKLESFKPRTIVEVDAFLPPTFCQDTFDEVIGRIPMPGTKFTVSMVGWFHNYKGDDLYGFDITLEALNILRNDLYVDITIIASVNGIRNKSLYNSFKARRDEFGLTNSFILIEENLTELYPLLLVSHLFLRPTNTDGNSVSIKEAMWFGCNVIASDAADRPEGVVLFANRDSKDLAEKISFLLLHNEFLPLDDRLDKIKSKKYIHPLISKVYELE